MWRSVGPCIDDISSYARDMADTFSKVELCSFATKGDNIIRQRGGLYPALVSFQESEMRNRPDQLQFAKENSEPPPPIQSA